MLDVEHIRNFVERLSYKPGWSFEIYQGAWEGPHIKITATGLPNTYGDNDLDIGVHSMIPPMESEEALAHWIAWRLGRIELHEMREFFKLDGHIIFDPHQELANEDR